MDMQPTTTTNEVRRTPPPALPSREKSFLREVLSFAIIVLIIVLPIRLFVAQPFIVNGSSMDPTLATGEYLIIDELSRHFEPPKRGEVIVFKFPGNPQKFFIKRVIGLPGESVELRGNTVTIKNADNPNGFALAEDYVKNPGTGGDFLSVTLGDSEYFVMGDNRSVSFDSRSWGPLDEKFIVGRAFVRLFPFSTLSILPGDATNAFE